MSRNRHDCTCSIGREHIIRDPDRYRLTVHWIDRKRAGEDTVFFLTLRGTLNFVFPFSCTLVCFDSLFLFRSCNLIDQNMFRRQNAKRHAENGVRTCGENTEAQVLRIGNFQGKLHAFTASDPVLLHRTYSLRPVQSFKIKQLIRIFRNPQFPLIQFLFYYRILAALADTVFAPNLFPCKSSLAMVAKIYRRMFTIC